MDLDYYRAEAAFRQFLTFNSKYGMFHYLLAEVALREGRTRSALKQVANASEFDTGDEQAIFLHVTSMVRNIGGDYSGALQASEQAVDLSLRGPDRSTILWFHAFNLIMLGRIEEAKSFIDEGWNLDRITKPERYIALYAFVGDSEKSKSILSSLHSEVIDNFFLALGYVALGDLDRAFTSIRAGIDNRNRRLLISLIVAEWWDPLREDPRFDEMLALLDSRVTHTEQYLRDHKIAQGEP